ncbi:hypothetical protein VTN31DRAFT_170 [Thermomyces dupontii]|uniref:uncharacterized protein n=1 Tax=Talaromyces thermophilus TaxID=28565 RepID=UPI0037421CB6
MPYEAAKALAATFCWRIRYALTPLFGTDFPDMCLSPQQSGFGRMLIDADVIEQAARNAQRYRMLELQNKANSGAALGREPTSRPSPTTSPSLSKLRGRGRPPSSSSTTKKASATNTPLCHRASLQRESSPSTDDDDSEASSRRISTTTGSPSRRGSSSFTPINGVPPLRSPRGNVDGRSDNHHDSSPSSPPPPGSRKRPLLPSPSKILASVSRGYNSRILSSKLRRSLQDNDNDAESEHGSSSDTENPCQSRHRRHRRTTKDNSSVSVTLSDMMTDSELSSSSSSSLSSSYSFSFTDEDEEEKEEDADDEKKEEARHSRQPRDASPSPSRSSSSSSPSRNTVVRRLTREVKAAQALLTLQLQGGGEAHSSSTKNSRDPMNSGGFPRLGRLRASGVIEEGEMRERKRLRRASA